MPGASSTLTFAPVLFLAWAALRFDLRIACAELVLVGIFVTAQTVGGLGPFGDAVDTDRVSSLIGGMLTQGYLASAALLVLPLGIAVQRNTILLDRITADGRLFRRNFTESLVGMAFLEPDKTGGDLVIVDLNETALGILGGREESLLGLRVSDVMDVGPGYEEAVPQLIAGSIDGWRGEGPLVFARAGQVTLQISSLGESGDEPFFAAQLLDVTAEYDARHGLEAAQTLTNATLDTTNCIIMVTNLEGSVVQGQPGHVGDHRLPRGRAAGPQGLGDGHHPVGRRRRRGADHVAEPLRRTDRSGVGLDHQDRREAPHRLEHQHRP